MVLLIPASMLMWLYSIARRGLRLLGVVSCLPLLAFGQSSYGPQGGEFRISGALLGDQIAASVSIDSSGGYLVWQDNATDGDGLGISARKLDSDFSGVFGQFRVNEVGAGDQQNPEVALLHNGGAVFVWQGNQSGANKVYARFLAADGTFSTGDLAVSAANFAQSNPALAVLKDGTILIVWASLGEDGDMLGVFGRCFAPGGRPVSGEFQVNQFTRYNQRSPAVAALPNGGFMVLWISEQERRENSVDVYARIYSGAGQPSGGEFLVNAGDAPASVICANPTAVVFQDGSVLASWSQRDTQVLDNEWDVYLRSFDSAGNATGSPVKANAHQHGNHYGPHLAANGNTVLAVWTSDGQDGSAEGIFGRFFGPDASAQSDEFQVNTYATSEQIYPAVAGDGQSRFLAVWSSFVGGITSFDLLAQRYGLAGIKPAAPFISALSSSALSVSWPEDAGAGTVASYELYIDGSAQPVVPTSMPWTLDGLAPSSAHTVRLGYVFANGDPSALSDSATGTTWGPDNNFDGLPDDWEAKYFGNDPSEWPSPNADPDGDGATVLQEFLAGTDPTDPKSVLRMRISNTAQGAFLIWNTQPGLVYQVQSETNLQSGWSDLGSPRFAADKQDSVLLGNAPGQAVYYRVKRLR